MEQQKLFKGRDRRRKGWFWLDNDYLNGYARFFGAIGTAIYVSLCRHVDNETQKCFPAQELIAEENNIGRRTVGQYIKVFEKYHILSVEREKDPRTKKWLNNVYTLLDKTEWIKPEKPLKGKRKVVHKQTSPMESQKQTDTEPQANNDESHRQPLPNKETHIIKTHIKEGTQGVPELNVLIELFKSVNPSYERLFSNTTQRLALTRLVEKYGDEKVKNMIDYLPKSNSEKYAPTITTPLQLEDKLGQLISFINKSSNKNQII